MWLPSINVNGGYGYKSLLSDGRMSPREKMIVMNHWIVIQDSLGLPNTFFFFPLKSLKSYF